MKSFASSFVLGLSSFLLANSAIAQQQAPPARQQDDRTNSPALQAHEEPSRSQSERGAAERDDPRARIQAQRGERGLITQEFKEHMLRLREQQLASRGAPEPNIVATSGPQWVPIGPTNTDYEQNGDFTGLVVDSGRARTILPDPADANTVYFLTSGGGLWKTANFLSNPPTWTPLTDNLVSTSGGSVAFGRTSSVLYLGLGDPFDVINVAGVMLKSIDGGMTWNAGVHLGAPFSVRDVKVDLSSGTTTATDIVLAATDAGLFRSTDGGTTYNQVALGGSPGLSVWSIVNTTAGWLASAQPCSFQPATECGTTSTLYISTDHGATWNPITNGSNGFNTAGRTTLAAGTGAANNIVYAFAENTVSPDDQRGLFRSIDGGQTWTDLGLNAKAATNASGNTDNPDMDLMHDQAFYNQMMLVDPTDTNGNTIYLGGNLSTAKSTDGGQTWLLLTNWLAQFSLPYAHADFHGAAFSNIGGTKTLFFGSDGGLFVSTDAGLHWDSSKNQGLQTFLVYTLESTPGFPSEVMIGTQDNGTRVRKGATNTYNQSRGGDGVGTAMSQANTNTSMTSVPGNSYATNQTNQIPDTEEAFVFSTPPLVSDAIFQVSIAAPTAALDPSGKVFFTYSALQVYQTTDGGLTWTIIGKIGGATNTITLPTSTSLRATVHGIGVSPVDLQHIGVIGAAGNIAFTANGGTTWTGVSLNTVLPGFASFTSSFTWADNLTMYVTSVAPQAGVVRIAKSTDGGTTWARADGGLPDVPVNRVIVDPRDATESTLLAASLQGVFRSTDGGATWAPYGTSLSNAYVNDLYMPPDGSFLRMGSYGRGVWELPFLSFSGATLTDDVASCDHDGVLDNGETGTLTVTLHNDGGTTLSNITATVSSTNPAVTFPNGTTIVFPAASAGQNTNGTVQVALNGASGIQQLNFTIQYNDPALSLSGPVTAAASFRGNAVEKAASSANDNIEAQNSAWTVTGTAPSVPDTDTWQRRTISPIEHRWATYDSNAPTDVQLVSPTLQVGASAFTVSWEQRYLFDFFGSTFFDGMVVEISQDGGATWNDVGGANLAPTYDHTLAGGTPLFNRPAFDGQSAGYPALVPVTLNLGTTFANKNVMLRFRVATDINVGAPGVEIRNITTTGLTNTPFSAVTLQTPCATTTALTSSLNPSIFGNNVTFTATVTGGARVATGNVTFMDGASTLGMSTLDLSGAATFATAALAVGTHPITASYVGDANHAPSVSPAVQQVVNPASLASTTTALSSSVNPSSFGQSVTFTATVTSGSAGTPTGTVTFKDGATMLGMGTLNGSAMATFTSSTLTVGSHSITAVYSGDATFASSTSAALAQAVSQAPTVTAVTSTTNPSVFGQAVTFTATVTPTPAGTPTGTVTFKDGATTLGTGTLNGSAMATFATSALTVGSHLITAVYGGDTNFAASTSSALTQTVNQANTITGTVTTSLNPSIVGQPVTFTATVSAVAPGAGTPSGVVNFMDGVASIGAATLSGGVATLTAPILTAGSHTISTSYGGDVNFRGSTGLLTNPQVVTQANTTGTLTSSLNPSIFGQSVTFTATVSAVAPGGGTPTGIVSFMDGVASIGTGTLTGGVATFTTSALTAGSHNISTSYGGDANFKGSSGLLTTNPQVVNQASTSTAVISSINPSASGQSVTFTATVTSGGGTPSGAVTFKDGVTTLGTGALNGAGVATFTTTTLTIGMHTITAAYGGNSNFAASTSTSITQTVTADASSTALVSSANPSVFGQSVTFTATVTSTSPSTPTGTVTFKDGTTTLGTITLNGSAMATLATSALTGGSHSITAVYSGDATFASSTSAALAQTVSQAPTATAVTSATNPSVFGQAVTFTATVTPTPAGTPTGTVIFKDGATTLGTGTLNGSAMATFASSTLGVGSHSITAVYNGDANFTTSTSTALTQTVNQAPTATAVTSSANPSLFGQPVTFTATVTPTPAGTPTGTVTFKDGAATLGTGTLNGSGVATFNTGALAGGVHSITAIYSGDSNFITSTSAALTQTVSQASTSTAVASSQNPSVTGQSVTFTATVTSASGTPTGSVTFKDGSTVLGTVALNASSMAAITTSALTAGSHSITAVYGGDSSFAGSTSAMLTQTVQGTTNTALSSAPNPSTFGQAVTFTATVTSGSAGTPTGTVTFKDGGATLGTGTLNGAATATFTSSTVTVGSHSITAVYGGDSNFITSTSAPLTQTVNTAPTLTAVSSSANPSVFGQSVTFTATVTSTTSGTPTGTMTFKDGAVTLGTGALNASGVATFSTGSLTGGLHTISAVYGGDANFSSSALTITQTVGLASSSTTVASSLNPSTFGQSVTFTAAVTSAAATPTGTVTFKDGATTFGTGTLNGSGMATFTTSTLSASSHSITAVYSGDTNFATSTSTALTQTVNAPSSTAVISSANPSVFGSLVTFTATVTSTAPGTPTGVVTFKDGATTLGSGTLNGSAMATLSTGTLSAGTHSITAAYNGDATFAASTSVVLTQTVNPVATSTTLASSVNPSLFGQSVTFTAIVTPGGSGTVTFKDGTATLGTAPLQATVPGPSATFAITTLAAGSHTITAVYNGDANTQTSTSPVLAQTVNKAASSTAVASSLNPSVFGNGVTFTATVNSTAGMPTGTVTFKDGAAVLGTGLLSASGIATFATTTLSAGSHTITAVYGGDSNFITSISAALTQTVKATTSTALASSANPSNVGQSVTFTATVTPTSSGTPTGNITFMDGTMTLGPGTLNASAVATFSTSTLAVGNHSITAVYAGDANFAGSTSTALTETISTPDFSVSATPQTQTIKAGQAATVTFTVTPVNGSKQAVTFGCTGLPTNSTCTFSPPSVTLDGTNNATSTGTIQTMANSAVPFAPEPDQPQHEMPYVPLTVFTVAALAALLAALRLTRSNVRRLGAFAVLFVSITLGLAACAGGSHHNANGTPPGSYNIMVSGTVTGGATHSVAVTVVVQ